MAVNDLPGDDGSVPHPSPRRSLRAIHFQIFYTSQAALLRLLQIKEYKMRNKVPSIVTESILVYILYILSTFRQTASVLCSLELLNGNNQRL